MAEALQLLAVAVIAGVGAMVNSIAGGGTLLTFPALVAFGIPPLVANATSTVALTPGALTSMLGYRSRLRGLRRWSFVFAGPSVAGGLVGGWLLLATPADRFSVIVPWLVLGATGLFAVQGPVRSWLRRHAPPSSVEDDAHFVPAHSSGALAAQFFVGVYGGYFGAGIGILMLAVLGFLGFSDIHRMNGLKNWGGFCINAVAAGLFVASGIVNWPVAAAMTVGSMAGGYFTASLAQRVPQVAVRRAIVGIGVASGIWLLWAPL